MAILSSAELLQGTKVEKPGVKPLTEEDYFELRQQLKEAIRKNMRKDLGSSVGSSQAKKNIPYDNFGSFFGPSQSSIAQRVIEQSKSMLEVQQLATKVIKSIGSNKKSSASLLEQKIKVQQLKESRDYSFLNSSDCERPTFPTKECPLTKISISRSGAQVYKLPLKSLQSMKMPARKESNNIKERKHDSMHCQSKPSTWPDEVSPAKRLNITSSNPRIELHSNDGKAVAKPAVQRGLHTKTTAATRHKANDKNPNSGVHKSLLDGKKGYHEPNKAKQMPNHPQSLKHHIPDGHKASLPKSPIVDNRNLIEEKVFGESKNAKMMQNHLQFSLKYQAPDGHKPSLSKPQRGTKRQLEQEKDLCEPKKGKLMSNKLQSSSKQQVPNGYKAPSQKLQTAKKTKRPTHDFYDEDGVESELHSILYKLARRDRERPMRNDDYNDDIDCMVSNFNDIQKEERKSLRIARKEDEIETRREGGKVKNKEAATEQTGERLIFFCIT